MKKLLKFGSLSLFMSLLVACGGGESTNTTDSEPKEVTNEDTDVKVSFILKSFDEHWRAVQSGAEEKADELGVGVTVLGPKSESDFEEQVRMIEDQITQGADALVIAPSQPEAVIPTLKRATEVGIPVLLLDTDADYDAKETFIGTGNYEAGKLAGEFILENVDLNAGDKVAIIRGVLGDTTHNNRTDGAAEVLEAAGLEIIVQPGDADRTKSTNVMENILTSNPDVKVVFATGEEMGLGALRAVTTAGLADNIKVVSFDGVPEGLESVKNGGLLATVAQRPFYMGQIGIESAIKAINGEDVEARIDTGVEVVSIENVDEFIK